MLSSKNKAKCSYWRIPAPCFDNSLIPGFWERSEKGLTIMRGRSINHVCLFPNLASENRNHWKTFSNPKRHMEKTHSSELCMLSVAAAASSRSSNSTNAKPLCLPVVLSRGILTSFISPNGMKAECRAASLTVSSKPENKLVSYHNTVASFHADKVFLRKSMHYLIL